MKDVVIVPAFNRPELLALCLSHLFACPEIGDHEVWVRCESRAPVDFIRDNTTVSRNYDVRLQLCPPHNYHGNSFNVLNAYKDAVASGASRVYLVEDDVLVSPDFFRWHTAMYERQPNLFSSVGWHCRRRADVKPGGVDPLLFFTSHQDYASIGVCWRASMLALLTAHCRPEYFDNPVGYIRRCFPGSPLDTCFSEQDGLIMRILEQSIDPVAWPMRRRCSHVGWWGYHRQSARRIQVGGGAGAGDLGLRIEVARRIVRNDDELRAYNGGMYGGDCEPVIEECGWQAKDLLEVRL